ncbi:MAG: AIR synthase-related protein, partial [Gammaproteobacteria bacterium]|nr:AIR synthase-related protein [Gammaproteobacteria bacterium]
QNIFPTPVVGVVGVLDDATRRIPQHFAAAGHLLFLAGPEGGDALGASAFLKEHHGRTDGRPPRPDLDAEVRLGAFLRSAGAAGLAASARDLSEGGLAAAATESLFAPDGSRLGAELHLECADRLEGPLFGEGPARALLSVLPADSGALAELAAREGVPLTAVGSVGGDALRIRVNGSSTVSLDLEGLADTFRNSLGRMALA